LRALKLTIFHSKRHLTGWSNRPGSSNVAPTPTYATSYFRLASFAEARNTIRTLRNQMFFILSISDDVSAAPVRNAVLAHAGYAVIPVRTGPAAMEVLASRSVSAVVVSSSLSDYDRLLVCAEARRQGIPCVVLDPYEHMSESGTEMRINPLDGPEVFLKAVATLLRPAQ